MEEAVMKCSYHVARRFGLKDRGLVREKGLAADVSCVRCGHHRRSFHLRRWQGALAVGVEHVFVNGTPVLLNGERTSARPGREIEKELEIHMKHLLGLEGIVGGGNHSFARRSGEVRQRGRGRCTQTRHAQRKVVVNLFYEPSTRTRTSFGLAARGLVPMSSISRLAEASTAKGETFIDTAKNIEAMGIDMVVVRHSSPSAPHVLAKHLQPHVRVVNAGDGALNTRRKRLLDIFTIRQAAQTHCGPHGGVSRRHRLHSQARARKQRFTASPRSVPR